MYNEGAGPVLQILARGMGVQVVIGGMVALEVPGWWHGGPGGAQMVADCVSHQLTTMHHTMVASKEEVTMFR